MRLPVIDGLSASAALVEQGAVVAVSVTAHSPEDHALTYAWQDSCGGTFSAPAATSTSWTAPAQDTTCPLSVRIADALNATSVTAYLVIRVESGSQVGSANVTATVDTYPVMTLGTVDVFVVTTTPAPENLSVGITAHLAATGQDPDGSDVSFAWSSNCYGTFTPSASEADVTFHHDDPRAICTLTLIVTDGSGQSITGIVELTGAGSYGIGGTISGLAGGLILATPGQPDLAVPAGATIFVFANRVPSYTGYAVTVLQQPSNPAQVCAVTNGAGSVGSSDVTSIAVSCQDVSEWTDWKQVAASDSHTMAVKTDGTLWAWGNNGYGQLGDGTFNYYSASPVQVGNGFASVAAGPYHTVAVKTDGTLWAWGYNGNGQLGDGTTTQQSSPVQVGNGFASVAAGPNHTVAVKADGTLWAWGSNGSGRLGDGTTMDRHSPVQVGQASPP
jgi:hypothetical protein